jgi:hypothetical protein
MSCFHRMRFAPVRWAGKVRRIQGGKARGAYSAPGASSNLRGKSRCPRTVRRITTSSPMIHEIVRLADAHALEAGLRFRARCRIPSKSALVSGVPGSSADSRSQWGQSCATLPSGTLHLPDRPRTASRSSHVSAGKGISGAASAIGNEPGRSTLPVASIVLGRAQDMVLFLAFLA